MPEGFDKVSDLKIVISAATGPLQEGIKDVQSLIRTFSTDATSGLGLLDGALGKVGGSVGALAGRLNIAIGALTAAGAVLQEVMAIGEKVADSVGAKKEFDAVSTSIGEVQNALLDLAGVAFQALQQEAGQAAASLIGFEVQTTKADATAENFAQRTLKNASERLQNFAQSVRELMPLDTQSYNVLATSLDRIDVKIKEIETSMASGKQEAASWWDSLTGTSLEERLSGLREQRDAVWKIVDAENQKWTPLVATPDADRSLASMEREISLLEAKAAALNMSAAAAAEYMLREKLRLDRDQNDFAYSPDGEKRLEELITRHLEAQKELEAGQEAKRQKQISDNRERNIDNVFKGLDRDLAMEETRARAVGLSADETKRLTIEETALLQIRLAGREPTEKEIELVRQSAAARVDAARATAQQSEQLQLLQDHARIAGRALENGFAGWIRGTEVSWKGMIASMLEDMAMLSARKFVLEPLFGGNGQGNTGGLVGDTVSSIFGSLGFGGQRESGGPVVPGLAYIVGEKRPELFIPNTPGTIIPDLNFVSNAAPAAAGRAGGEVHVFVHGTPEFDARVVSTAENVVVQRAPQIIGNSVAAVSDYRERQGLD